MTNQYRDALEDLDRLHAEGKLSQAQYDLHRAKLLAEASAPRKPLATRIVLFVVIVAALFVLLRVVFWLVGNA